MTEVTVNTTVATTMPGMECVVVTPASNGNTYTSKKFSTVTHVEMSPQGWTPVSQDVWSASVSGAVVTLNLVNTTTQPFALTIRGTCQV